MSTDLIARAQAGDGEAFRLLTDPHRRELQVHCYRILGSLQDAEDAMQDTLLAAWQGLGGYQGRASLRTWLYRVATSRCLNALRATSRRPRTDWSVPGVEPPDPTRLGEAIWLEPYPDVLLHGLPGPPGPEARYETTEAISLAFITALQVLPPRQRAVLILRDVLGYHAAEVADMLESSVESVTSALKRARRAMQRQQPRAEEFEPPPPPNSPAEQELVARLTSAFESGDVRALVDLLTQDVWVTMPPIPLEYQGRELASRFNTTVTFRQGRTYDLVPTRANGQLAFGAYLRAADGGARHANGLLVLTMRGNQISVMTRFDNSVLPYFGLPRTLPD